MGLKILCAGVLGVAKIPFYFVPSAIRKNPLTSMVDLIHSVMVCLDGGGKEGE